MSRFQVIRDGAFRRDEGLKRAVAAIAASSFIDQVSRLEREFRRCDTLYLLRDDLGNVSCFFMVAWEMLDIEGRDVPTLYTGLLAARPDQKSTGKAMKLLNHCVAEAQQWERGHREKLTVWGMTATPVVMAAVRKLFANTQPLDDGSYSDESARVARAVGRRLGVDHPLGLHPFVFPGLAAGVRYSDEERRRIALVGGAKSFTLFDRLGVDEARGDRLLFIAQIPTMLWRRDDWPGERHPGGDGSSAGSPA
jgi:hypothetical protein